MRFAITMHIPRLAARTIPIFLAVLLYQGHALAQAGITQGRSVAISEQYCEEERQFAEPWMQWAMHAREECKGIDSGMDAQMACLQRGTEQLDAMEAEHAQIYLSQVRNLRPDHPVVANILRRLKSNRDLASAILRYDDAEPVSMGDRLKHACLAANIQPAQTPLRRR